MNRLIFKCLISTRSGLFLTYVDRHSDPIGNRTRDLPACSAVPRPTAPPRIPSRYILCGNNQRQLLRQIYRRVASGMGRAMAQAVSRRPLTAEARVRSRGQSMWDLWWTKWHWDRFFPKYFGFSLSISFHRCSITWKSGKTNHLHHRVAQ
jgi:hypothetical protein